MAKHETLASAASLKEFGLVVSLAHPPVLKGKLWSLLMTTDLLKDSNG
jgi:hypothetical protein